MAHADVQFKPIRTALREQHNRELREAQFRAMRRNNSAAMLPAEAECYISHAKALVVARAKCIAEAHTAFHEPVGRDAAAELVSFLNTVVAAHKSSFQAAAGLRHMRTGQSTMQLPFLVQGFERKARLALEEAQAILDAQRVAMKNRPKDDRSKTKYVVDTCVFNWLADAVIKEESLPADGGFAITHVQVDEINKTKDEERRARLFLVQTHLRCELIPTDTFLFGRSRFGLAKLGEGKLFGILKQELDSLNGRKDNNDRDALIAEASIANGHTLLTADGDLKAATERHGGKVIFFSRPGP